MSETATDPAICGNRGPRIGNEGTPICMLPKMHEGNHVPDKSWFRELRDWSDHAIAGVANMDLRDREPVMTGDRIPDPRAVREGAEFIDLHGEDAALSADAVDAVAALLTRIRETWGDLPVSIKLNATILARAITERA